MADVEPIENGDGIDETLPDVVKNFLRGGGELEEIRLDERGKWTHEGLDFENPKIIELFSRSVGRTEGGTWVLEVGRFTYPITVENTGFFVERVDFSTSPPTLKLSDQTEDTLDPTTLEYEPTGKLFCEVKDGEFRARFKRPAYYQVAEHLEDRDGTAVLEIDGEDYPIADFDDLE
ncbi:MAG: hypothetical protein ACQEVA_04490 [Myxococcota bacterium]